MTINTLPAVFEDTPMDVYIINGERWLNGPQIGGGLGFSTPDDAVRKIYSRSQREFTDLTLVIEVPTRTGPKLTRLYNARGAALIALKANTAKAEAFRRWVLDVLEGLADDTPALPATGLPKGVMNDLQTMFVEKRGGSALLRYFAAGLRNFEVAKLLDLSQDVVRRRRRIAESLGLIDPPANLAALRKAPQFQRMLEARRG